jgi:hypothetical protein
MDNILLRILLPFLLLTAACASSRLPEGREFKYDVGEVVYYKVDQMPMLIDKKLVKNGQPVYRVVFKDAEGILKYNVIAEHEILDAPAPDLGDN